MPRKPQSQADVPDNALANIPAAALEAELKRRQRHVDTLRRRLARLLAEADKLRSEIAAVGGSAAQTPKAAQGQVLQPRLRNITSLVEVLKRVLTDEALSVSEATNRVLAAGYQSKSSRFRQIVGQTLAGSDQFERVGHGRYKAK